MPYNRLFAVDPSLTCSGWALFSVAPSSLLAVGKLKSLPAAVPMSQRLLDLQRRIGAVFDEVQLRPDDVVVCESQTTMRDPRAAFKVEQVRGIFETIARERGAAVPGRLNPRTVQQEVMGLRGKQLRRDVVKRTAVQVVLNVYSEGLKALGFPCTEAGLKKHQDVVDAILIGSLAVDKIRAAEHGRMPLEDIFKPRQSSGRGLSI